MRRIRVGPPRTAPERIAAPSEQVLALGCHRLPDLVARAQPPLLAPPAREREREVEPDDRLGLLLGDGDDALHELLARQAVAQVGELSVTDVGQPQELLRALPLARPVDREYAHARARRRRTRRTRDRSCARGGPTPPSA